MSKETEIAVTGAFLSLALAIHHAKKLYIHESQMAEDLGLEKPDDWFSRCDTLFTKTYAEQADVIGLSRNKQTLEALVRLEIPLECMTTETAKLPTMFVFDPWLGMGRGGIMRRPESQWHVRLKMEGGGGFGWRGDADDRNHAEGQAIAEATGKLANSVYEVVSVSAPQS